jgi:hypothetical protein
MDKAPETKEDEKEEEVRESRSRATQYVNLPPISFYSHSSHDMVDKEDALLFTYYCVMAAVYILVAFVIYVKVFRKKGKYHG